MGECQKYARKVTCLTVIMISNHSYCRPSFLYYMMEQRLGRILSYIYDFSLAVTPGIGLGIMYNAMQN